MNDPLDSLDLGGVVVPDPPSIEHLRRRVRVRRTKKAAGAGVIAALAVAGVATLGPSSDPVEVAATAPALPESTATSVFAPSWTWVPNDAMIARDGSATGYGERVGSDASGLVIYLEDGVPCITAATCTAGRTSYDEMTFEDEFRSAALSQAALFELEGPANPFAGWSMVFVPHATGDLHGGSNPDAAVPGRTETASLVGASNIEAMLVDVAGKYSSVDRVLVTGTGSGGLGALVNYERVAAAFPAATVDLLVDSAVIPLSSELLPDCLVNRLTRGWSRDFPSGWEAALSRDYDQRLAGVYEYLSVTYPDATFGVLASRGDARVRSLFAFGANQCETSEDIMPETYAASLDEVRALFDELPNWDAFLIAGEAHGFLTIPADEVGADVVTSNGTAWLQRYAAP